MPTDSAEEAAFNGLREYERGDDPRHIDWRATAARRGRPSGVEAERSRLVLPAIDARRLMSERVGDRERLDHTLAAALLLADVAHRDRVGVFVCADTVQGSGSHPEHFLSIFVIFEGRNEGRACTI